MPGAEKYPHVSSEPGSSIWLLYKVGDRKVERWAGLYIEGSVKLYTGAESCFLVSSGETVRVTFQKVFSNCGKWIGGRYTWIQGDQ